MNVGVGTAIVFLILAVWSASHQYWLLVALFGFFAYCCWLGRR